MKRADKIVAWSHRRYTLREAVENMKFLLTYGK